MLIHLYVNIEIMIKEKVINLEGFSEQERDRKGKLYNYVLIK